MNDFQFANSELLLLLLATPVMWIFCSRAKRSLQKEREQIIPSVIKKFGPDLTSDLRFFLHGPFWISLAFACAVIALARPQWGYTESKQRRMGIDIVVAIDLSVSMLAEDIKPNRLSVAKRKVRDFLKLSKGDRVALVSFAGSAFVEAPLTYDTGAIRNLVKYLTTELQPIPGSNLDAVARSTSQLLNNIGADKAALLIFSDGEFDPNFNERATEIFKTASITPVLIATGTTKGAPILQKGSFKRKDDGSLILSKISLPPLFEKAGGFAIPSSPDQNDIQKAYAYLKNTLGNSEYDTASSKIWNEYYFVPLLIALFSLLMAKIAPPNKKKHVLTQPVIALLSMYILVLPHNAFAHDTELGKKYLDSGKFSQAESIFKRLSRSNPNYGNLNALGQSQYRQGKFEEALESYSQASESTQNPKQQANALYNIGNTLTQLGKFEEAKANFEKANALNETDSETLNNLEYVKKLIQKQNQQQSKQDQEENEQQQNNQEKDEQQKGSGGGKGKQQNSENKQNNPKDSNETQQSSKGQSKKDPEKKPNEDNKEQSGADSGDTKDKSNQDKEKQDQKDGSKDKRNDASDNQQSQKQAQPADKGGSSPQSSSLDSQTLSQLDAIGESNQAKIKYRYKKGLKQLRELDQEVPRMDW